MKAQCEIRGLEKQLLLAHMRADLETEESFQLIQKCDLGLMFNIICRKDAKLWRR